MNRDSLEAALQKQEALSDPNLRQALLATFHARKVKKGHPLVHAGEWWQTIYFIARGACRLYYSDGRGREFNKGFFLDGQFVLPMAPSAQYRASLFTIAALEATELWAADYWSCRRMLESRGMWHAFALPFAEWLADEKFKREYELLVYGPSERFRRFQESHPEWVQRIPDYHLASYLGMTPVSYSRIRHRPNG